jgi:4-hydroxy-2-oxoheptanedioate aldolase
LQESYVLRELDLGIHAVQVPNIEKVEEIRDLIKFSKYPPIGSRGFSPFTRNGDYSILGARNLTVESNENQLIVINIENNNVIEKVDYILDHDEIDIVFVGLFDLSKFLGVPGEINHPEVKQFLEKLNKKIIDAGKFPGTISTSVEHMKYLLDIGMKYIVHLVDCEMIKASYTKLVNEFRRITN